MSTNPPDHLVVPQVPEVPVPRNDCPEERRTQVKIMATVIASLAFALLALVTIHQVTAAKNYLHSVQQRQENAYHVGRSVPCNSAGIGIRANGDVYQCSGR